jgi:ssDNA thymidine ADP-ribosyltransferase, DarT
MIYHVTHLENLPQMVDGVLWSDSERIRQDMNCQVVGMREIKRRRLEELEVVCHPGTNVGQYVPFYFCFRSIMLYLLYQGNHPELTYRGGQRPIVHLEADLRATVEWAEAKGKRWAFSSGNAGTRYTPFFDDLRKLDVLDWQAIAATDWRDPFVKEGKQAEFLVEESFPWQLIGRIGVIDDDTAQRVTRALREAEHKPAIVVARNWYY